MVIFSGNTTGSIASIPLNIPCTISSWFLSNTDGGSISVSVTVADGNGNDVVVYQDTISNGKAKESNVPIKVVANSYIIITASASCDYYFCITE